MHKSIHFSRLLIASLLLICHFTLAAQDSAPVLTANGRQIYCPGSTINIVTDFTITDRDNTGIALLNIQISSSYQQGLDLLELQGNHPTIRTTWNQNEGKLTLFSANNTEILFSDLENAVKNVVFSSLSTTPAQEKTFSITIDDANYLPLTDHFYEFVDSERITWQQAKIEAETRTYYGRQGYLATLISQEEAEFAGKQAQGTGWIGASDEETEGEWKWVTGPEAGTVFWIGQVSGTTPNFAFWNNNEPNDFRGNDPVGEDYAHITNPNLQNAIPGSWNDLPNSGGTGLYIPQGYIVEYGSPGDPPLNISASTSIYIPEITAFTETEVCEGGLATITATPSEGEIYWYEIDNQGNEIEVGRGNSFTTTVTENTLYFATIVVNGCNSLPRTAVNITVNERPTITNTTNDLICDGAAILSAESSAGDVYWYESANSTTPVFVGENFQTPNLSNTTRYYVEANINGCNSVTRTEVIAEVDSSVPNFELIQNTAILCVDIGSVDIETTNAQGNYRYIWKKEGELLSETGGILNANDIGTYTVSAVSEAGCTSEEQTITVITSEKSNLTKDDVIITDDSSNNSIQIANLNIGSGNYEFAIDNKSGPYSTNGFFQNLATGIHTLYIRDIGGCGIQEYQFSILGYPKFFTPNGDGENDFWQISGFDQNFYTTSKIFIYNRFGKLIFTIDQNDNGWDGNFSGRKLPENTYWFRVILIDNNGYSIEKFGNFSLIR